MISGALTCLISSDPSESLWLHSISMYNTIHIKYVYDKHYTHNMHIAILM